MAEVFFYLETVGRVSGDPHKIEIWFVEHDGAYYLCSEGRDKADWVQNITQEPAVRYALGTRMNDHSDLQPATGNVLHDASDGRISPVSDLFREKYGWADGLLVEIKPN